MSRSVEKALDQWQRASQADRARDDLNRLEAEVASLPFLARRTRQLMDATIKLALIAEVSLVALFFMGVLVLLVLYAFKSSMGIDLLSGTHLGDLF